MSSVRVVSPLSSEVIACRTVPLIRIPGSKSHTIRALLLSALTRGITRIVNPLYSEDTESALVVIKNWGARCTVHEDMLEVDTSALKALLVPLQDNVYVGNSGTTLFFASALAALSVKSLTFDGDASLRTRSAEPLLAALEVLGAKIERTAGGCVPYTVRGPIHSGVVAVSCPTSQYASALLFALSCVRGTSTMCPQLAGEHPYIDMTLHWLHHYRAEIENHDYERIIVHKGIGFPHAVSMSPLYIHGDYSSATFFFCAAAITGISIAVHGLVKDDTQGDKQVLEIIREMGCRYTWSKEHEHDVVTVTRSNTLHGGEFDLSALPDALPVLAVLGSFAQGPLRLYNIAHARAKETDRLAVMNVELTRLGVIVEEQDDALIIHSSYGLQGGQVNSHHDHRIAMAFAIGALGALGEIAIEHAEAVAVTFPSFYQCLGQLGAHIS